ncbi:DUF4116 domain-containing protein [Alphaproteobacteria bacterium]|nr:DUF4116 domain-containing protein [Alphaproteobacteria bacterium]
MGIYVLYSHPMNFLNAVCSAWTDNTSLRKAIDGNVDGQATLYNDNEEDTHVILECNLHSALATMYFLSLKADESVMGFSISYESGDGVGAISLKNGKYVEMTILEEHLHALSSSEVEEDDEYKDDTISENRVTWRDSLQTSFGEYFAKHGNTDELNLVDPFVALADVGGTPLFEELSDTTETVKKLLSEKIDWNDVESLRGSLMQKPEEFWKDHRSRVREIMEDAPEEALNDPSVFKAIIPEVSGWLIEYGSASIRSNKEIARLGLEADKKNGWGANVLEYVSPKLQKDREFLLEAVKFAPNEFYNLPQEFRQDIEFIIAAASEVYSSLPDDIQCDKDVALAYARSEDDGWFASRLHESLKGDKDIAKAFLEGGGQFARLPETHHNDDECFLVFLENYKEEYPDSNYELSNSFEKWAPNGKVLSIEIVKECLNHRPKFACMLTSRNFKLEDWAELLKEYDIQDYIDTDTMLELAVPLKWDFDAPVLWKKLQIDGVVGGSDKEDLIDADDVSNKEKKPLLLEATRKIEELGAMLVLQARKGDLSGLKALKELNKRL